MQNGVGVVGVLLQRLYRFSGRKNQQFDLAPLGFSLHVVHHRECRKRRCQLPGVSSDMNCWQD